MGNLKIKEWEVEKLINAEYNPRILKQHQFKDLKDSIERFGLVDPILVNINKERFGIIIGGHQRTFVAQKMGFKKIPAVELDLTLEQEKELNIRLNKNQGEWDFESLANNFEQDDLLDWGFNDFDFGVDGESFEDKVKENEGEDDSKTKIVLEYTASEFEKVSDALSKIANTPEQAIWTLLKL